MKFVNIARKYGAQVAVAGSALMAGSAFAAVGEGVTSAITDAGADAATVGAAVLAVLVGIAAFKWIRRAV